jgi:hypothetical protein
MAGTVVARLEAILGADTRGFDKAMDQSESRMHSVRKTAGVAGAAIVGGLALGLEKSVHAAMEAQTSQSRLEVAFKTAGLSAGRYRKNVDDLEQSGRKLGFTDEQTKSSLGSLLVATHDMAKATNNLGVAQDIARFKHIDLIQVAASDQAARHQHSAEHVPAGRVEGEVSGAYPGHEEGYRGDLQA